MSFSQEDYHKLLVLIHPQMDENNNHQATNVISNFISNYVQGISNFILLSTLNFALMHHTDWIVDIGATNHIVH